jgi:hypothetical protein
MSDFVSFMTTKGSYSVIYWSKYWSKGAVSRTVSTRATSNNTKLNSYSLLRCISLISLYSLISFNSSAHVGLLSGS